MEREAGDRFGILSTPDFVSIAPEGGAPIAPGAVLDADDLASLTATAGQNYAGGVLRYARLDPATGLPETVPSVEDGAPQPAPPRAVDLPNASPVPGVSLGVETPGGPESQTFQARITQAPNQGGLFILEPIPELAAMGVTAMRPTPVAVNATLTPEQAERLHYRPDAKVSDVTAVMRYAVETVHGFRQLGATRGPDFAPSAEDGRAETSIFIDVAPADNAPEARALLFPMSPGGALEGRVPAGDPEGDAFSFAVVSAPALDDLAFAPDGSFTYVQTDPIDFDDGAGGALDFVEDRFTVRATPSDGLAGPAATQLIRILKPATKAPIVLDPTRTDVFFEEDRTPIRLGGLPANDVILRHDRPDRLFGFGGLDAMDGGPGDDELTPGPDAGTMTLGACADVIIGTPAELDGDSIVDLAAEDGKRVLDPTGDPVRAALFAAGGALTVDLDGDGAPEAVVTVLNGYEGPILNADFANAAPEAAPI